ncbi:MAG TPA: hypothetical protein VMW83_08035 [Spirochaetia bacterium]|nr:hypothetical protein [Spirochaetia bacterium]
MKRGLVYLLLLGGLLAPPGPAPLRPAVAGTPAGRVVVLVADRLAAADLPACPHWGSLAAHGAVALMNDNTAGRCTPVNGYLTMGAGAHLTAGSSAGRAGESRETTAAGTAGEEFHMRTGRWPPGPSLVVLDIAAIERAAEKLPWPGQPGALGESLHRAGLTTCVLGSADTIDGQQRFAPLLAMDQSGLVDGGDIGPGLLVRDPMFPGGWRTDYGSLLGAFRSHRADFTVIDPGDLDRLDLARPELLEPVWNSRRQEALSRFDGLLADLSAEMNFDRDLLLVVTPVPARLEPPGPTLAPVLAVGPSFRPGALTSPTTRRDGLVANIDIAPTVLAFFGLPQPPAMAGRPLRSDPGVLSPARLNQIAGQNLLTYRARPSLQRLYVGGQFAALGLSALAILTPRRRGAKALLFFYLVLLAVPLAYLLVPLWPVDSVPVLGLEVLAADLSLAAAAYLAGRVTGLDPFILLCLATAAALLGDLLAGAPLGHRSIMGYDFIDGARYYGLGNEYMGVLIGSAVVAMTGLFRRWPGRAVFGLVGVFYAVALVATGAPQVGANAGGAIAVAAAFASSAFLLAGMSLNRRTAAAVAGLVVVAAAGLAFWDFSRPVVVQSHIGRAAGQILTGDWPGIWQIIARKLAMNYRLLRYTIWARIFVVSLVSLALVLYWPRQSLAALRAREPFLFKSLAAVLVGALTALVFNDSGVVAAATAIVFALPQLVGVVLREREGG